MAKKKRKVAEEARAEKISRRRWLVTTGISIVALTDSIYGRLKPAQVIVLQAPPPPPAPVQVARSITMPLEAGTYVYSGTPLALRASVVGRWWEDPGTSVFQAKHRVTASS
jgi:hypothetical protein